ncbi:hypothetical protein GO998_12965 [Ralstonia syzygii]|uniref:Uncharacterized protein n=1 Tax=Ralstonia syzygii TaxID=28097 RepID=A0ABX7ZGM1_9RALS|nr:hypothetical protein [Ralstonia syzygii]QUP54583.1 hypothetical protein GO998_12965 [Ralstonia syzygii]
MKFLLWFTFACGACFSGISTAAADQQAYDQALVAMHKKNWSAATTLLEQHPAGPSAALLDYLLAVCWYYRANAVKALDYVTAARGGEPPLQEPYSNDARMLAQQLATELFSQRQQLHRVRIAEYEKAGFGFAAAPTPSKDLARMFPSQRSAERESAAAALKAAKHRERASYERDLAGLIAKAPDPEGLQGDPIPHANAPLELAIPNSK